MAEVKKNDKGEIVQITYTDHAGYSAGIEPSPMTEDGIRIWTRGKTGGGSPVDLGRAEARRFAHDVLDLSGSE